VPPKNGDDPEINVTLDLRRATLVPGVTTAHRQAERVENVIGEVTEDRAGIGVDIAERQAP
jgi:hypothetical protein